ncbi:MAG: hypothetical protein Q8K67_11195 [Geothrix sp.]|nr:hypothetical protein [Geothrix sp.]
MIGWLIGIGILVLFTGSIAVVLMDQDRDHPAKHRPNELDQARYHAVRLRHALEYLISRWPDRCNSEALEQARNVAKEAARVGL